jgi:GNAT superfamily N-acetyltransferase
MPKAEIKIRPARLEDASFIAALARELGYPVEGGAVRERLQWILARDDQRVVVAELPDGSVCAWLQAHSSHALVSGLRVEIVGLVVSEGMRRRGVGRSLVAQAEVWAAEISADTVDVRSNAKRVESHSFYPSLGFLPAKTQIAYRKRPGI